LDIHKTQDYYAAIAPVYDEIAGYFEIDSEKLREPFKKHYRSFFRNRRVLEIACGTGYWTEVVGETAASVLATDISESMLNLAKRRCGHLSSVTFQLADAYSLESISGDFDAAFASNWWSHMPKDMAPVFLNALHRKLQHGALVLFVDQLPNKIGFCALNTKNVKIVNGNRLEFRSAPDGNIYEVVKNLPTQQELQECLAGVVKGLTYHEEHGVWSVWYTM
jgi:ubiquinone/menaquinone biosynthesis C-methylase UbiE